MAEMYEVKVKVISQKGTCGAGHKVGDEWTISGKTPEGICLSAFNALFPATRALTFGGSFPWSNDPYTATAACPDAANPVVFELKRVRWPTPTRASSPGPKNQAIRSVLAAYNISCATGTE